MTDDRKFKEVIRQRMAKTGESYTTARMMVLASTAPSDRRPDSGSSKPADPTVVPELCPSCRRKPADPRDPYFMCGYCADEKAGFDHSPDYWD